MRNGFKFKGIHSSEYGVTVRTKSRPLRPEVKSFTVDMPCRDGVYDFTRANPMERECYYERNITVSMAVCASGLGELQNKLSQLALWLTGSGELVFDDMPYTVWQGRLIDEIVFLPEHAGRSAVIEIVFRVQPFSTCVFDSDGPMLDFTVPLDTNIPIGIDAHLTGTVTGSENIRVLNFGDRPVRPVIKLTGNVRSVIMTACGKTLSFTASGEASVDCEKQSVMSGDNYLAVSGEFFELKPGANTIRIENSNTSQITAEVSYSPQFTYGVDFDMIDWSDGDA